MFCLVRVIVVVSCCLFAFTLWVLWLLVMPVALMLSFFNHICFYVPALLHIHVK